MKENVQIQINKLKELVHNTVLAKPADFALNFYSVLTAINGLLSIQGSLIEKRLVLNDLEQNGKQDKVVYAQYTGLVKEYVYQQGVLSTALYDLAKTMQDPSLKDLGTLASRISANMLIFYERFARKINGVVGESAHFDISLTFAIVADIALASNRLIESANQKISNKIPKGISFLGKFLGKFGDILTFVANNLVDEHGNSKAVLYKFDDEHSKEKYVELALINDRLGDILRNEFHQSNLVVRLIEGLGESLEEFVVELASAWLPDGVNPWLETTQEEGTYFIGDQKENKNDKAYGTQFEDYLLGFLGDDYLSALGGNDHLNGGLGNDALNGGEGNDTLIDESGDDKYEFVGEYGHDTIYDNDGKGEISIDYIPLSAEEQITDSSWSTSNENYMINIAKTEYNVTGYYTLIIKHKYDSNKSITIQNWKQGDFGLNLIHLGEEHKKQENTGFVFGNDLHNIIYDQQYVAAFAGDDLIQTTQYDDIVIADEGNDAISTGDGNDHIYAGNGNDVVYAGIGTDYIDAGAGHDVVFSSALLYFRTSHAYLTNDGINPSRAPFPAYYSPDGSTPSKHEKIDIYEIKPHDNPLEKGYHNHFISSHTDNGRAGLTAYVTYQNGYFLLPTFTHEYVNDKGDARLWYFFREDKDLLNLGQGFQDADTVYGGAGNDLILGSSDADQLYGQADHDHLFGLNGHDLLDGGQGEDKLYGGDGLDILIGGEGQDILVGGLDRDQLYGGEGDDELNGDLILTNMTAQQRENLPFYQFGDDELDGGAGNDVLFGELGHDRLLGGLGRDILYGDTAGHTDLHGRDYLDGGDDHDRLYGQGNDDILYGGNGNDVLYGDDLNTSDKSFQGKDILDGGNGDDQLYGNGNDDILYGGDGDDQLYGDDTASYIDAHFAGHDTLYGGSGNDILVGHTGNDYLYGGEGDDYLYGEDDGLNFSSPFPFLFRPIVNKPTNDHLYGGQGNDHLEAGDGDDYLDGGDDHDYLEGGNGNDHLNGGHGNDQLYGDDGQDVLIASLGKDDLNGGTGFDTYIIQNEHLRDGMTKTIYDVNGDGKLMINGQNWADFTWQRIHVNRIKTDYALYHDAPTWYNGKGQFIQYYQNQLHLFISKDMAKVVIDNPHINHQYINIFDLNLALEYQSIQNDSPIYSLSSLIESQPHWIGKNEYAVNEINHRLVGAGKNDVLLGLQGNDDLIGWEGNDVLFGGGGNDTLYSGAGHHKNSGHDLLIGSTGNDTLIPEDGYDVLLGGQGDDRYILYAPSDVKVINNAGGGVDTLYLNRMHWNRLSLYQDQHDLVIIIDNNIQQQIRIQQHFNPENPEYAMDYIQAGGIRLNTAEINAKVIGQYQDFKQAQTLEDYQITLLDHHTALQNLIANALEHLNEHGQFYQNSQNTNLKQQYAQLLDGLNTANQILSNAEDNTLLGTEQNNLLFGGLGNDILQGGLGNDTYLYQLGSGKDTIIDTGGVDTLSLLNIEKEQLLFDLEREGIDHLVIGFADQQGHLDLNHEVHLYDWQNIEYLQLKDGLYHLKDVVFGGI